MGASTATTSAEDAAVLIRVRRAARAALIGAGYDGVRLTLLRHRRYFVFRVDAARRRRFVLRVRDGDAISRAAATAQLRWLASIAEQTRLVAPAPAGDAKSLEVDVDGERRWAALLTWVIGRPMSPPRWFVKPEVLTKVGRAVGELHTLSTKYALGRDRAHVPRWGAVRFFDHPNSAVSPRGRAVLGRREHETLHRAADRVRAAMTGLGEGRAHFGLIHGDLEPANWVFHRGQPRLIDFDEFGLGYYLFDLLQVLWTHAMWPDYPSMRQSLLAGYEHVRPLTGRERRHVNVFQAIPLITWCNRGVSPRDAADAEEFPKWVTPTLKRIRELCNVQ
jgi:Ser/Thr protein kinase RdoA (MazF antagonist)